MDKKSDPEWFEELKKKAKPEWVKILPEPGSPTTLAHELPKNLPADKVSTEGTKERRIWELIGLYYRAHQRWFDAIAIYSSMYNHFLEYQINNDVRVHKGMPLVWIADSYFALGFATLSKRYMMLTLCEDAINWEGNIDLADTGSYFRLAWRHAMSDKEFSRYSSEIYQLWLSDEDNAKYPEWGLQEIDNNWMIEIPSPNESGFYVANSLYINKLISELGESTGKVLERLSEYVLSCMPGCRTSRRQRTDSTDYDIVCSIDGASVDFRSEFGRYFVCECKDWGKPVDFGSFAKFCRVLDSVKSKFGIFFASEGISGQERYINAEKEQMKVYQDRGMVIVVIDKHDLSSVGEGSNFISILRDKYERVRLDIR